jgi:hypothetical protein
MLDSLSVEMVVWWPGIPTMLADICVIRSRVVRKQIRRLITSMKPATKSASATRRQLWEVRNDNVGILPDVHAHHGVFVRAGRGWGYSQSMPCMFSYVD